jgi:hypothetical protein
VKNLNIPTTMCNYDCISLPHFFYMGLLLTVGRLSGLLVNNLITYKRLFLKPCTNPLLSFDK